ncbi:hypothetical protein Godav_017046 [Gossypium davidsonii]|uniref:Uncharacterized protein n=1 Tax=Gossypium davidsonii TaxID=34287 RepID=A0A7J8QSS9_GOSDV|nr:hypothetical protein [Gossypium davidsonii]
MAWMVLPQFRGAAFIYERFVRDQIKKQGFLRENNNHKSHHHRSGNANSPNGKGKKKFVQFIVPKKILMGLIDVDVDGRGSKRLTEGVASGCK